MPRRRSTLFKKGSEQEPALATSISTNPKDSLTPDGGFSRRSSRRKSRSSTKSLWNNRFVPQDDNQTSNAIDSDEDRPLYDPATFASYETGTSPQFKETRANLYRFLQAAENDDVDVIDSMLLQREIDPAVQVSWEYSTRLNC